MDIEKFLYQTLSAAVTARVAPSANAGSADNLPLVVYSAAAGGRVANGDRGLGEAWTASISVLANEFSEARDLGVTISDALHDAWESGAAIPGAGVLAYLDETSMFTPASQTTLTAQDVHQRNAVFSVVLRPA